MPKIIEDVRLQLLSAAREILFTDGYGAMTMRAIAQRCGIAVGTAYNYFASKETLAAHVMLEDWQRALECMERESAAAQGAPQAVRAVYHEIARFWQSYAPVFSAYSDEGSAGGPVGRYHHLLVEQISSLLSPVLARHGCLYAPALPVFLTESLLSAAANGSDYYENIEPMILRVLTP